MANKIKVKQILGYKLFDSSTTYLEDSVYTSFKGESLECKKCKRSLTEICDGDSYLSYGIEYEISFCPFCGRKNEMKE